MLNAKGIYLWRIRDCENADIPTIVERAKDANFSHVIIKIANASYGYNYIDGVDKAAELAQALLVEGIEPWGYQYIYGVDPVGEAKTANRRMRETGCVGFVINAEKEYRDLTNNKTAAKTYMDNMDFSEPKALSTYRYPEVHPTFPYKEFLDRCDINMPQVYWMQATNSVEQLVECLNQYAKFDNTPVLPTGSAFCEHGWCATSGEINRFSRKAKELEVLGVNYWEWAATRNAGLWPVVRDFVWEDGSEPIDPEIPVDCCDELELTVIGNTKEIRLIDQAHGFLSDKIGELQYLKPEVQNLLSRSLYSEKNFDGLKLLVTSLENKQLELVENIIKAEKRLDGLFDIHHTLNDYVFDEAFPKLKELESKQIILENNYIEPLLNAQNKMQGMFDAIPETNHSHRKLFSWFWNRK